MAILASPNREKEQMCLLKELGPQGGKDKKSQGAAGPKKGKKGKKSDEKELKGDKQIYLVPVNVKLPWMVPKTVPAEYH